MCGVGLRTLRKRFMDIQPTWTNQPTDAAALERGGMNLKGYQEDMFKTGDIHRWDISLLITVLLFSKKCSREISKNSSHAKALETLRDRRNRLIGHASTDEMPTDDFNVHWPVISTALQTLGADPDEMQAILTGMLRFFD